MPASDLFVLTSAQRTTAMSFNDGNTDIAPIEITHSSPGVGINLNHEATSYRLKDTVPLTGCFIAPKRIVDDQAYIDGVPGMIEFLMTLPWCSLEIENIFAPTLNEE